MSRRRLGLGFLCALVMVCGIAACTGSGSRNPEPTVRVSGIVFDWRSGDPLAGALVETIGITPVQTALSESGGSFVLDAVPINGFVLLNVAVAGHVRTISPALLVGDESMSDAIAFAVSSADAAAFEAGFAVTRSDALGVVLGRTASEAGSGIPGVVDLQVLPATIEYEGPFFLGPGAVPSAGAGATTADGGFVFFNVSLGDVSVQASAQDLVFETQGTAVMEDTWSLVSVPGDGPGVGGSPTPTPTGTPGPQSFENDIVPIFSARGCTGSGCHRPPTTGGGLRLNQSATQIYDGVFQRCNTADPPNSLLLIKPLFEAAPNHTGGNIFLTTADPDYQKMLRWISDGAPNN